MSKLPPRPLTTPSGSHLPLPSLKSLLHRHHRYDLMTDPSPPTLRFLVVRSMSLIRTRGPPTIHPLRKPLLVLYPHSLPQTLREPTTPVSNLSVRLRSSTGDPKPVHSHPHLPSPQTSEPPSSHQDPTRSHGPGPRPERLSPRRLRPGPLPTPQQVLSSH